MAKENLSVESEQPVDSILGNLMETIARKGRGFVLGAVKDSDGKLQFEVKESLRPHDEWRPPSDYRAHDLETTDSFIEYAQKYGTKEKSLVFVSEDVCALVIDDQVDKGSREVINLELPKSKDWNDWNLVLGKPMFHKDLHAFLLAHESNLQDGNILAATSSVKVNSEVNYESDLTNDGDQIGIMFKTSKGEDLKMFPKGFSISIPVLDMDDQDVDFARVDIRLNVEMPAKAGDVKPTFTLICSKWTHVLKWRLKKEADKIANILSDWTVVRGTVGTKPHEVASAKINKGD